MQSLAGKLAVINGANPGIDHTLAERLTTEGYQHDVADRAAVFALPRPHEWTMASN